MSRQILFLVFTAAFLLLAENSFAQQECGSTDECAAGEQCLDGYCCGDNCIYPCMSCGAHGSEGICTYVERGEADPKGICGNDQACDGSGACLTGNGYACAADEECASNHCADGVCCSTACDGVCESCSLSGLAGTCSAILANTDPDNECIGNAPYCGGMCDGNRSCEFPGAGTVCGTCKACDGVGRCTLIPEDDAACGIIDCDALDSACRDYVDISSHRCLTFGQCKEPNEPQTCVIYADTCP